LSASRLDLLGGDRDQICQYGALGSLSLDHLVDDLRESRCLPGMRKNVWKFARDEWTAQERANRLGIGMVETVISNESSADVFVHFRDGKGFKLVLYCLPSSIDPRP
jgi:hypothetical protein